MTKLSEAERDGEAASRQIHTLKNTIGRLNIVGVVGFVLAFTTLSCYMAVLKCNVAIADLEKYK